MIINKTIQIIVKYSNQLLPSKIARLVEKYLTPEVIRYLFVGAGSALVFMISSNLIYLIIDKAKTASILGLAVAAIYGYFAHMILTFQVEPKHKTYIPRFILLLCLSFVYNVFMITFLHDVLHVMYSITTFLITITWPIVSFLFMKIFVFRKTLTDFDKKQITMEELINIYPKTRPELPPEYQDVYVDHHQTNRDPKNNIVSLSAKLEQWMHKQVAKPIKGQKQQEIRILEIGAGTLNHVKYEKNYIQYDVVEPFKELYENRPEHANINVIYDSVFDVGDNHRYDKIFSIAVLEHLEELPYIIAKSALLMDENAVFNFGIPSEGTILWELGYTITTGIEFQKRYGLEYDTMMKYEHVNTAHEIEQVCNVLFADIEYKVFGVHRELSIYQYFECRIPNLELCQKLIEHYENHVLNK